MFGEHLKKFPSSLSPNLPMFYNHCSDHTNGNGFWVFKFYFGFGCGSEWKSRQAWFKLRPLLIAAIKAQPRKILLLCLLRLSAEFILHL